MKKRREKYLVDSVDLFPLRNRNETRVAECIQEILDSLKDEFFSDKAIQDIYAYSLNQLPARYAQAGTIVLNDPVRKADIRKVVRAAFDFVAENPKE
ncbi:MAG: late competence development ComFB family protein [Deltaproteobacteria bacterium]|nr:late competence development ComFB family protein [Deltaproteobacteria bacterium]